MIRPWTNEDYEHAARLILQWRAEACRMWVDAENSIQRVKQVRISVPALTTVPADSAMLANEISPVEKNNNRQYFLRCAVPFGELRSLPSPFPSM